VNGNDKNSVKILAMFLACTVHAGGHWHLLRLLYVGS